MAGASGRKILDVEAAETAEPDIVAEGLSGAPQ